jgi:hypothetical protein
MIFYRHFFRFTPYQDFLLRRMVPILLELPKMIVSCENKMCPVEEPGTPGHTESGINFGSLAVISQRTGVRSMALRRRLLAGLLVSVSPLVTFYSEYLITPPVDLVLTTVLINPDNHLFGLQSSMGSGEGGLFVGPSEFQKWRAEPCLQARGDQGGF